MSDDSMSAFSMDPSEELGAQGPPRENRPRPIDKLEQLAAEGNFDDIFEHLFDESYNRRDPKTIFQYLRRSLQVACKEDLQTVSTRFLRHLLAFNSLLTLRIEMGVHKHLDAQREGDADPKHFRAEGTDITIEHWRQIVGLNLELLRTIAMTERQWALAKKASQDLVPMLKPHVPALTNMARHGGPKNGNGKHKNSNGDN